jgi:hypothetical protein
MAVTDFRAAECCLVAERTERKLNMRKLIFASAMLASLSTASHAAQLQCGTTLYGWYGCRQVYSDQELYERGQAAAEGNLDYNSRGGTRRPSSAACNLLSSPGWTLTTYGRMAAAFDCS